MRSAFDSLTTCDANIVQFESFEDKHCFSNGGTSFKYEFPTAFYYAGNTCAAPAASNETLSTTCATTTETPIVLANQWYYGDVNFGSDSDSPVLTTAEIAGIAAGGAVALVAAAAGAYYFMGSGAASGAATAMGGGANPMVSAV